MMPRFILVLLLFPCVAFAQTDTLLVKADTLINPATRQLDSLQRGFVLKSDSLKQTYEVQSRKLVSFRQRYTGKLDSLKSKRSVTPGNPLDTIGMAADAALYTKKIDSVNQQLESVQQKTTARIDSLKGKVNEQLGKLKIPKEAQGNVTQLTAAMDQVTVPSFDTGLASKTGLDGIDTGLPALPSTGNLPGVNVSDADLPALPTGIPGTDIKAPDLNGKLSATDVNAGKLNDLTGEASEVQKHVKEATGSTEGLGKTLETKASEQVKLPDQNMPDVPGLEGGVPKTGDEAKEQLMHVAKKEAMNHFAGKEAVLTGAMEKMSKYKQKYSSVSSLKDIQNEKHHNELKGKPLRERLIPALTLQFQSWQDFMLDINPSVGYKITSHITAGIGWNQRVAFNVPKNQFNTEAKVYGIRTYGEYTFNKGFGFRLDIETMNTPAKQKDPVTDAPPTRDWVWGALIGIKQKYPIYKKLKGNAQLMYNIFDKDHRSPYLDRVNFRIGLELTLKKKKTAAEAK